MITRNVKVGVALSAAYLVVVALYCLKLISGWILVFASGAVCVHCAFLIYLVYQEARLADLTEAIRRRFEAERRSGQPDKKRRLGSGSSTR